jgi:hypothetical protein
MKYNWTVVAETIGSALKQGNPAMDAYFTTGLEVVNVIYEGNLPRAIENLILKMWLGDVEVSTEVELIAKIAYFELQERGAIGGLVTEKLINEIGLTKATQTFKETFIEQRNKSE